MGDSFLQAPLLEITISSLALVVAAVAVLCEVGAGDSQSAPPTFRAGIAGAPPTHQLFQDSKALFQFFDALGCGSHDFPLFPTIQRCEDAA